MEPRAQRRAGDGRRGRPARRSRRGARTVQAGRGQGAGSRRTRTAPMQGARPRSRIPTYGKTGPIHSAAPICGVGGTTGIGSAPRCACCRRPGAARPIRRRRRLAAELCRSRAVVRRWPNPSSAFRVTTTTRSGLRAKRPFPMPGLPAAIGRPVDGSGSPVTFGFKVRVLPQARNSQPYDGRPRCCASSSCIPICPVQAKYDATVHLRKAEAAGARILPDSVAIHVEAGPDDLVTGILIRRPDRSETRLEARQLVIAANAIEGPKLLLDVAQRALSQWRRQRLRRGGPLPHGHPVQLTRALSPVPVWQRRGPQEVSAIHEMRDGDHRRRHGAFLMNVGNQGWEWAGPNLAELTRGFVRGRAFRACPARCGPVALLARDDAGGAHRAAPRSRQPDNARSRPDRRDRRAETPRLLPAG